MSRFPQLLLIILLAGLISAPAYASDIEIAADCTLASAIMAANSDAEAGGCPAGDGADVIVLKENVALEAELPAITSEITINGDWNSISGEGSFRIFLVETTGALTISEATLTQGKTDGRGGAIYNKGWLTILESSVTDSSARRFGGAIANWGVASVKDSSFRSNISRLGGAIYNRSGATLEIDGGAFLENAAQTVDGSDQADSVINVFGGAIYNHGSLEIDDSSFSENTSQGDAAAIANLSQAEIADSTFITNSAELDGGAIVNSASLIIEEGTFIENSAKGNYGGVIVNHGSVTISESDFINNLAPGAGGALANWGDANISESDFTGNKTSLQGGAIFSVGELSVHDSKLRDNASSRGGAIMNADGGSAAISESDFTGNSGETFGGGILNISEAPLAVSDSDFRDNEAEQGGGAIYSVGVASVAGSSFRDNTTAGYGGGLANGGSLSVSGSSFRDNTADEDEGGGLRNFGMLDLDSESRFASNKGGDCIGCGAEQDLLRPAFAPVKMAARGGSRVSADIVVAGACTLYDAISSANADRAIGHCQAGDGADSIALTADITLTRPLPYITSEISIEGNGFSISGDEKFRIFIVSSGKSLSIRNATLTKGRTHANGGAIQNYGTLNVVDSVFSLNRATRGGAIWSSRAVTVSDSEFSNNRASNRGGAIYRSRGTVTQSGNTFSGNRPDNCYNC